MLRNVSVIGIVTMALCFGGSPALALAWCPLLHQPAATRACCPVHRPRPAPAPPCTVHCVAVGEPAMAARPAAAQAIAIAAIPVAVRTPVVHGRQAFEVHVVFPDSGGLWLRDRVLRI